MYYRTCPYCGAALDPGERCDCLDEARAKPEKRHRCHELLDKKEAAPRATNTQSGKAKQEVSETNCFASNHTGK